MPRRDLPWHRWRFDLDRTLLGLFFAFVAWSSLRHAEDGADVAGGIFFLSLAACIAFFEWRWRKGPRFTIRDDQREP